MAPKVVIVDAGCLFFSIIALHNSDRTTTGAAAIRQKSGTATEILSYEWMNFLVPFLGHTVSRSQVSSTYQPASQAAIRCLGSGRTPQATAPVRQEMLLMDLLN